MNNAHDNLSMLFQTIFGIEDRTDNLPPSTESKDKETPVEVLVEGGATSSLGGEPPGGTKGGEGGTGRTLLAC